MEKEIQLLRSKFYLPYIPSTAIKSAKIPLYKIVVINAGNDPIKRILVNKLTDNSKSFVSWEDLDSVFRNAAVADKFYARLGFTCKKFDNYLEIKR